MEEKFVYKKVGAVEFSLLSPKVIKNMAVVKIVTPELYDKEGYPVDGGLMDLRMGVVDPGLRCRTCGARANECLGHFGYIELARPVIHIKFVNKIYDLLRGTCKDCGKALIDKQKITKYKRELESLKDATIDVIKEKIKKIIDEMKNVKKCPYCKATQPKITLEKPYTFIENETKLTPIEIRARLERIPDEHLFLFGLNPESARPEWMVLTLLPVPPVSMRPSITLETGERSEDDLTHKLSDIIRINQRLFENINAGAPEVIIDDLWDLLQYHITTYFDNEIAQIPPARHRSGQPLKTLTERIKSKEGRIRYNLAGKRTNFSARSVISPDPMIKLNEVGVPLSVAMKLTVPEKVTEWNLEYLKKFIERGPKVYPGSNYIIRPDGKRKKITDETKEQLLEEIQPGYIVERHLLDGDIVLFNRQPSLHRMSMMAHKVRIVPGQTFRIHPSVCHPYNADFDGDEMNLHVPQTEEARAEAEILMEIQTQIISPRYGLSIITAIQDSISGNYLLTKDAKLTRKEAIDLLTSIGIYDFSKLPKKEYVSGKDVFSCILPEDFDFIGKSKSGDVIIKKGRLIEGTMDKLNLGEASGLLLRKLYEKYGPEKTLDIMGKISKLGIKFLLKEGFTMSLADLDIKEEIKQEIESVIKKAYDDVFEVIRIYKEGKLEAFPGRTIEETLELKILEILNKARNKVGEIINENINKDTCTYIMIESGARGNILNLTQMAGIVGQQALRGRRISKGYSKRTLSCFPKNDLSPEARGFIKHGFREGLSPAEFFFAAITGRDSLMDTALRTPKSGYLYRRLANALQDLKVAYDYTVRDASGKIIQFLYGEDGIDVAKSVAGTIDIKSIVEKVAEKS